MKITWAACTLFGSAGVGGVEFIEETILSDRAGAILKKLDISGWRKDEEDSIVAHYAGYSAVVWDDETHGWSLLIRAPDGDVIKAVQANSITVQ